MGPMGPTPDAEPTITADPKHQPFHRVFNIALRILATRGSDVMGVRMMMTTMTMIVMVMMPLNARSGSKRIHYYKILVFIHLATLTIPVLVP